MKYLYLLLFLSGICLCSQAQIATTIDPRSIQLPQYANLTAIGSSIPAPQQGMMVYNQSTATNWYYNGNNWVNLANALSTPAEPEGFGSWGCANHALKSYQPVGNPDGKNSDYLGKSVCISGDYAIIGADYDDDDDSGLLDNGSASIYKRNSNTGVWDFQTILFDNSLNLLIEFGNSVSISGDYVIVGANKDDEGGLTDNGSASIYRRNATTGAWELQTKLINPLAASYDFFGKSVCISGDYAIVGAYLDDEGGLTNNGSASIYKRNTSSGDWDLQTKLTNPGGSNGNLFGISVSIWGEYALIGSPNDGGNGYSESGSASLFKLNPNTGAWEFQRKFTNTIPSIFDHFGNSVCISDYSIIIGSSSDDEEGWSDNGSVSIFKQDSRFGNWEFQVKLTNPSAADNDYFGSSVSISGNYAIVGTPFDDEGGLTNNGSACIYRKYGETWQLVSKTSNPGSLSNSESFGSSVAIDGSPGAFIIGAYGVNYSKGLAVFGKVK
ncbi:MAG: hypothetical protein ACRCVT_13230 [Leadbetterella sp.]